MQKKNLNETNQLGIVCIHKTFFKLIKSQILELQHCLVTLLHLQKISKKKIVINICVELFSVLN